MTSTIYEVPVNLIYKTGVQGKGRFFFGLGATPSYAIGGKNKFQAKGDTTKPFSVNNTSAITANNPIALFDIGLSMTAGYELATGLFFRVYYTIGVSDIGLGGEVDKNRMWGIGTGYYFGKGRNMKENSTT